MAALYVNYNSTPNIHALLFQSGFMNPNLSKTIFRHIYGS